MPKSFSCGVRESDHTCNVPDEHRLNVSIVLRLAPFTATSELQSRSQNLPVSYSTRLDSSNVPHVRACIAIHPIRHREPPEIFAAACDPAQEQKQDGQSEVECVCHM